MASPIGKNDQKPIGFIVSLSNGELSFTFLRPRVKELFSSNQAVEKKRTIFLLLPHVETRKFSSMAPHWRGGAQVLAVTLGILQCCGWLSGQTIRTSVGMMERGSDQWSMSHERVKRGWVWNQFFVVEEYTGTEPLYVGKVGLPHVFGCTLPAYFSMQGENLLQAKRDACTVHLNVAIYKSFMCADSVRLVD